MPLRDGGFGFRFVGRAGAGGQQLAVCVPEKAAHVAHIVGLAHRQVALTGDAAVDVVVRFLAAGGDQPQRAVAALVFVVLRQAQRGGDADLVAVDRWVHRIRGELRPAVDEVGRRIRINAPVVLRVAGPAPVVVAKAGVSVARFVDDAGQGVGPGRVLIDVSATGAFGIVRRRQPARRVEAVADAGRTRRGDAHQMPRRVISEQQAAAKRIGDAGEPACRVAQCHDPAVALGDGLQHARCVKLIARLVTAAREH